MTLKRPLKEVLNFNMGRVMGFEPTNAGTTIRSLNHLATPAILFNFKLFKILVLINSRIYNLLKPDNYAWVYLLLVFTNLMLF